LNDGELEILVVVGGFGGVLMTIVGFGDFFVMFREVRTEEVRTEAAGGQIEGNGNVSKKAREDDEVVPPMLKLHWIFRVLGFSLACLHTTWSILGLTMAEDDMYQALRFFLSPFTLMTFVLAFLSNLRNKSKTFVHTMFLVFTMAEVVEVIRFVRLRNMYSCAGSIF